MPSSVKHPLLAYSRWYWQMRGLPAQSRMDMSIFKEVLLKVECQSLRIFEWGSGASTLYYSQFLRHSGRPFDRYSADNSREWAARGGEKVANSHLSEQVHIFCSEFQAFWELPGYSDENPLPPQDYINSTRVKEYVDYPKDLGGRFDVMMVDGRFKRSCSQVAAQVLAPQGILILHDADWAHYHSSLALYPHVQFLETGALPGMRDRSHVALASINDSPLITELTEKFRGPGENG